VFTITDRGRQLMGANPERVGNEQLEQFDEFRDFVARSRSAQTRRPAEATEDTSPATPDDQIEAAVAEANAALASELLDRVRNQPPYFLERLVLKLLVAMGYTGSLGDANHLGRSGDHGVDGVVNQDVLGLDRIYVQAKRYTDRTVGRPEIQAFVGALHGQQASRGVFITTSRFAREAREYVERVQQRVVLIDGEDLARLMIAHQVGVQVEQTVVLLKVDEDFFD
jgi:restriction system protein